MICELRGTGAKTLSVEDAFARSASQRPWLCNYLVELPDEVCELSDLEELELGYCAVSMLPDGIDKLTKLIHIGDHRLDPKYRFFCNELPTRYSDQHLSNMYMLCEFMYEFSFEDDNSTVDYASNDANDKLHDISTKSLEWDEQLQDLISDQMDEALRDTDSSLSDADIFARAGAEAGEKSP